MFFTNDRYGTVLDLKASLTNTGIIVILYYGICFRLTSIHLVRSIDHNSIKWGWRIMNSQWIWSVFIMTLSIKTTTLRKTQELAKVELWMFTGPYIVGTISFPVHLHLVCMRTLCVVNDGWRTLLSLVVRSKHWLEHGDTAQSLIYMLFREHCFYKMLNNRFVSTTMYSVYVTIHFTDLLWCTVRRSATIIMLLTVIRPETFCDRIECAIFHHLK